jgi:hypothetical protein
VSSLRYSSASYALAVTTKYGGIPASKYPNRSFVINSQIAEAAGFSFMISGFLYFIACPPAFQRLRALVQAVSRRLTVEPGTHPATLALDSRLGQSPSLSQNCPCRQLTAVSFVLILILAAHDAGLNTLRKPISKPRPASDCGI